MCLDPCAPRSLLTALTAAAQFKATTNLQQVAVQVTDKQNHAVHGLAVADFTLSENGHPQKIAFFGAETEPVSLSILLDSSDSMKASRKLDRARAAIRAILHATRPEDQIALIPFTDRTGTFIPLTPAERQEPPFIRVPSNGTGTALYDALASTLCHMRTSQKMKQALIVITDGADQSSRLRIEQLIAEAHASKPEIFMIGFWSRDESDDFRSGGPTLTLVNGHQIENPIQVFARISRETGAESFFPANDHDLEQVLQRILEIVQGQYTLSYYPENVDADAQASSESRPQRNHRNRASLRSAPKLRPRDRPLRSNLLRSLQSRPPLSLGTSGHPCRRNDLPRRFLQPLHRLAEPSRSALSGRRI